MCFLQKESVSPFFLETLESRFSLKEEEEPFWRKIQILFKNIQHPSLFKTKEFHEKSSSNKNEEIFNNIFFPFFWIESFIFMSFIHHESSFSIPLRLKHVTNMS